MFKKIKNRINTWRRRRLEYVTVALLYFLSMNVYHSFDEKRRCVVLICIKDLKGWGYGKSRVFHIFSLLNNGDGEVKLGDNSMGLYFQECDKSLVCVLRKADSRVTPTARVNCHSRPSITNFIETCRIVSDSIYSDVKLSLPVARYITWNKRAVCSNKQRSAAQWHGSPSPLRPFYVRWLCSPSDGHVHVEQAITPQGPSPPVLRPSSPIR